VAPVANSASRATGIPAPPPATPVTGAALPVTGAAAPVAPTARGPAGLSVRISGNRFVDAAGKTLRLRGANHSGTEFACIQGWGQFSGPGDESVFAGMETWKMNAVRIPMNEGCWLGISGADSVHGGANYRDAITNWVKLAHKHGLIAVLDLSWAAPGTHTPSGQQPMANADHSLDFWKSVATTFKDDPAVVFDLFNEPFLNHAKLSTDAWTCWRDGCSLTGGEDGLTGTWKTAGMQQLVDAVRSTGATQPVMLGGLEWSNDLEGWLEHMPKDPLGQIAAAFHQYQGNLCQRMSCWATTMAKIAARVPLVTGELGEDDCGHSFTDEYLDWADSVGASYLMWTWNAWGEPTATSCGSQKYPLIADWAGTPTPYGVSYKARLAK
jgi:endoglucanase